MHPGMPPYPGTHFEKHKEQALIAESFKADFFFVADTLWADAGSPPHRLDRFEAMTLLAAIAAVTTHIGLVGTLSTTYCEPFNIARQVLSLDHISNGRAGWNLVTTDPKGSSDNYGRFHGISHGERYAIGAEAYQVVTGLWDSFEDDALPQDKENGVFLIPEKLHTLDHKGKYFESKGPLNLHRSPQGRPIVFTATASDDGLAFAARYIDCVFTPGSYGIGVNQDFYRKLKAKAVEYGRGPREVSILPGCTPLIAPTREAAQAIQEARRQQIGVQGAINYLSGSFHGFDLERGRRVQRQHDAYAPHRARGEPHRPAVRHALRVPQGPFRGHRRGRRRRDAGMVRGRSVRRFHAGRIAARSVADVRRSGGADP
jgi:FMN-dependent oxidoreductase (nitrilotriacetate monooxygenase family)